MCCDPSMASGLKLPVSPVLLLSLLCLEHAAAGLQEVITPPPPGDGCGGQSPRAARVAILTIALPFC